jgi:hypothetical protein
METPPLTAAAAAAAAVRFRDGGLDGEHRCVDGLGDGRADGGGGRCRAHGRLQAREGVGAGDRRRWGGGCPLALREAERRLALKQADALSQAGRQGRVSSC